MGEAGGAEEPRRLVGAKEEFVRVRKKDLERLTTEVMQIRDFLPRILNGDVLESFQKLKMLEKTPDETFVARFLERADRSSFKV